ncbi:MAG: hypothetical protein JRG97_01085 [Deltaproteobacteria bacterium]|nr:hypothetical protein [Deltaproteobacteria bacterium]MBW2051807.1 hypothetical protein [Deltaproteobacteria bacterium]MBW2139649.1 hypothetical protein [Deltaproteobacteria bacterium]MBW2322146.1 hypothetical protein [Deltaproteobacteria bacterium]
MSSELSEMDKLSHLLEHWQEHNEEHVANYKKWADRADANGRSETGILLREAADVTARVTGLFARAKETLD